VADATLHKNLGGWMKHVGTIRIVVAKDFHRMGMGSILANELFLHALKSGLEKVVAEVMDAQPGAKRVFEKLGFKLEATFRGHVRDQIGVRHDLLILTKDLEEFWRTSRPTNTSPTRPAKWRADPGTENPGRHPEPGRS